MSTMITHLHVLLAVLLLNRTGDHVLADIVGLVQVEELADLGGSLGTKSLGHAGVGESLDLAVPLLYDHQV